MNLTSTFKVKKTISSVAKLVLLGALVSCGSSKVVPTSDICSLKKHWKDNIFQVEINGTPINKNYYTFDEAKEVTKILASRNKCMP